jgi:hypothetical protein
MEPNQVHVVAAAVFGDAEQIINAFKSRLAGQIVRDVGDGYWRNGIHDDMAFVHPVTATRLYPGPLPDPNTAPNSPAPDSLAKALRKHHMGPSVLLGDVTNLHQSQQTCVGHLICLKEPL